MKTFVDILHAITRRTAIRTTPRQSGGVCESSPYTHKPPARPLSKFKLAGARPPYQGGEFAAAQHTPAAITPATLTTSVGPGRPSTSEVREPHVAYQTKGTTPDIPPPRRWDVAEGIEQLQKSGIKHEQSLAIIKQISASHNDLLYAIGQLRDDMNELRNDMHSMMWKMLAYQAVLMTALLTIFATIMLVAIKL